MQNTHRQSRTIAELFTAMRATEDAAYARYCSAQAAYRAARNLDEAYTADVEMRAAERDLARAVIAQRDLDPNRGPSH